MRHSQKPLWLIPFALLTTAVIGAIATYSPAHAASGCWAPTNASHLTSVSMSLQTGLITPLIPAQGSGVHIYVGIVVIYARTGSGSNTVSVGTSSNFTLIAQYIDGTSGYSAYGGPFSLDLQGFDLGANLPLDITYPSGTTPTIDEAYATWSTTPPSASCNVQLSPAPTLGVNVLNTPGVAIVSPSPIGGTGGGGISAGNCTGATPTPTPTAGPTPTSSYVPCAVATSDPVDAGKMQDTVIVFGVIGLALLTAIVVGMARR